MTPAPGVIIISPDLYIPGGYLSYLYSLQANYNILIKVCSSCKSNVLEW